MLFEVIPLVGGDVAVLVCGTQPAAVLDEGPVGADHVVGEERGAALGGRQARMTP